MWGGGAGVGFGGGENGKGVILTDRDHVMSLAPPGISGECRRVLLRRVPRALVSLWSVEIAGTSVGKGGGHCRKTSRT